MRRNFTPDQQLVDRLLSNDTDAFEELYRRYWYSLYSYCFGKLNSADDAKRIVRIVFISLWDKRNQIPVSFSLLTYLYTEVRNEVVKCVNSKIENSTESGLIDKQIIQGFNTHELYKARRPVENNSLFPKQAGHRSGEKTVIQKESWWEKYYSRTNIKGLKSALQAKLNF